MSSWGGEEPKVTGLEAWGGRNRKTRTVGFLPFLGNSDRRFPVSYVGREGQREDGEVTATWSGSGLVPEMGVIGRKSEAEVQQYERK